MSTVSNKLSGIAARTLALTMAGFTAAFVLWSPTSIASRVAGDSISGTAINAGIVALCSLGWADVIWRDIGGRLIWRDIGGRLIWPSFPGPLRHRICVMVYAALAGLTGLRAFVAAGSDRWEVIFLGMYYLTCAVGIGVVSVAIALEPRHAEG